MHVAQFYTSAGLICPWNIPHVFLLCWLPHVIGSISQTQVSCLLALFSLLEALAGTPGKGILLQRLFFFSYRYTEQIHLVSYSPHTAGSLVPPNTTFSLFLPVLCPKCDHGFQVASRYSSIPSLRLRFSAPVYQIPAPCSLYQKYLQCIHLS